MAVPGNNPKEIAAEVIRIVEECKAEGLSKEELREIFSPLAMPPNLSIKSKAVVKRPKLLQTQNNIARVLRILGLLGLTLALASLYILAKGDSSNSNLRFHLLAVVRIALIKVLPYWNWTEMYYTRCIVRNPFFQAPSHLNPDDCNLCESLDAIVRTSGVSQAFMTEEYIRRERPAILTDAMEDWPIMTTDQLWFDNITEIYLQQDNYQVCSVATNLRLGTNGDFVKLLKRLYSPHTREWFLHWENCQKEMAKAVRAFYRRPYFVSPSLDFTGSNWVLMSSDFKGRVYKKIEARDSLLMMYQLRGSNHVRISPKEPCRASCPELLERVQEGEILVMTNLLWNFEYIPGEEGDNLALISEVSWPTMD